MKNKPKMILRFVIFMCLINTHIGLSQTPGLRRDYNKYLKQAALLAYIDSATIIKTNPKAALPFGNLTFNKVIAYDYEGIEEAVMSVTGDNGKFIPFITKQQSLNQNQTNEVINILNDKKTYGETSAACFVPRLAFVFYNDNTVVFKTDICLDCNYLTADTEIPAMKHNKIIGDGYEYYAIGFTDSGKSKIRKLCAELGFFYGQPVD